MKIDINIRILLLILALIVSMEMKSQVHNMKASDNLDVLTRIDLKTVPRKYKSYNKQKYEFRNAILRNNKLWQEDQKDTIYNIKYVVPLRYYVIEEIITRNYIFGVTYYSDSIHFTYSSYVSFKDPLVDYALRGDYFKIKEYMGDSLSYQDLKERIPSSPFVDFVVKWDTNWFEDFIKHVRCSECTHLYVKRICKKDDESFNYECYDFDDGLPIKVYDFYKSPQYIAPTQKFNYPRR